MPTTNMINVESSNIRRVGYNAESKRLYIQFKSGTTYRYLNVERETYTTLMSSESIGRAFAALIKSHPEEYPYKKLNLEPGEEDVED